MENKKYYWIINGKYYEVSKETYQKYKKDYDRSQKLKQYEAEVTVLSLDAPITAEQALADVLEDPHSNVEESAIHNIFIEKMRNARNKLSAEERLLLELLFEQNKSQDEIAEITGIPQRTISYKQEKILNKMRKMMGIKK